MILCELSPPPSPLAILRSPGLELALRQGTRQDAEAALSALRRGGERSPACQATLDYAQGLLHARLGRHPAAATTLSGAGARFHALRFRAEAAFCRAEQALVLALGGGDGTAAQAEAGALLAPDGHGDGHALHGLAAGAIAWQRGDLRAALSAFECGLGHAGLLLRGRGLLGLGTTLRLLGHGRPAQRQLLAAASLFRQLGDPCRERIALEQLALLALQEGRDQEARAHAIRQAALVRSLGDADADAERPTPEALLGQPAGRRTPAYL